MDLHAPQLQGFFDIPVDHLIGVPILANYFREKFQDTSDVVVVSPDVGSVSRSRKFAEWLEVPLAIIDKRRPKANVSEIMNIIGDVNNKRVVLVDDLIDTGGTILNAVNALVEIGAKEVYACCTHGVLSGSALERIDASPMKEIVTLNTIPVQQDKKISKRVSLSVAPVFAEAIERIYGDISISTLFTQQEIK
jgi:ribose-phosphate pyrophosphokinase